MRESDHLKRFIAGLTALLFLVSTFTLPPALARNAPLPSDGNPYKEFPADPGLVRIPPEMGKIEDFYQAANCKKPAACSQQPVVILIQDAHEIPDAQKNIQRLIQHFQQQYGVNLVALEGANARLDARIFKTFPDKEILKKVFQNYQEQGELAAGTGAAIFGREGTRYEGVEDWPLYEKGIGLYLRTMRAEPAILEKLKGLEKQLDSEKEKIYSPELLEIEKILEDFYRNRGDMLKTLQRLASVQPPPEDSELSLILKESGVRTREETLESEVKGIARKIDSFLKAKAGEEGGRERLSEFNARYQDFQTSRMTAKAFAVFLKKLTARDRLPFRISRTLAGSMREQKKIEQIKGTKFFEDFEHYADEVRDSLIRGEEERQLIARSRELRLMERLARRELSREDWDEIKRKSQERHPEAFYAEGSSRLEDSELWSNHFAFYRNSEQRDASLFKNLMKIMETRAILVAGGFHAQGLTRRLKEKGISYLKLMPNIESIPEETNYQAHMLGEVSWKKHLKPENGKINLYKAFVRGTRDRLLGISPVISSEARNPGDFSPPLEVRNNMAPDPRLLKEWRDKIILDLAEQNQIEKAGQYTVYIDELAENASKEKIRAQWMANIDRFLEGLQGLKARRAVSRENVLNLLNVAGIPASATTPAVLQMGAEVPDFNSSPVDFEENAAPAVEEVKERIRTDLMELLPDDTGLKLKEITLKNVLLAWEAASPEQRKGIEILSKARFEIKLPWETEPQTKIDEIVQSILYQKPETINGIAASLPEGSYFLNSGGTAVAFSTADDQQVIVISSKIRTRPWFMPQAKESFEVNGWQIDILPRLQVLAEMGELDEAQKNLLQAAKTEIADAGYELIDDHDENFGWSAGDSRFYLLDPGAVRPKKELPSKSEPRSEARNAGIAKDWVDFDALRANGLPFTVRIRLRMRIENELGKSQGNPGEWVDFLQILFNETKGLDLNSKAEVKKLFYELAVSRKVAGNEKFSGVTQKAIDLYLEMNRQMNSNEEALDESLFNQLINTVHYAPSTALIRWLFSTFIERESEQKIPADLKARLLQQLQAGGEGVALLAHYFQDTSLPLELRMFAYGLMPPAKRAEAGRPVQMARDLLEEYRKMNPVVFLSQTPSWLLTQMRLLHLAITLVLYATDENEELPFDPVDQVLNSSMLITLHQREGEYANAALAYNSLAMIEKNRNKTDLENILFVLAHEVGHNLESRYPAGAFAEFIAELAAHVFFEKMGWEEAMKGRRQDAHSYFSGFFENVAQGEPAYGNNEHTAGFGALEEVSLLDDQLRASGQPGISYWKLLRETLDLGAKTAEDARPFETVTLQLRNRYTGAGIPGTLPEVDEPTHGLVYPWVTKRSEARLSSDAAKPGPYRQELESASGIQEIARKTGVIREEAEKFVDAHLPEFQGLAQFLLNHITYVDEENFDKALKESVEKFKSGLKDKPFIIVTADRPTRHQDVKSEWFVYQKAEQKGLPRPEAVLEAGKLADWLADYSRSSPGRQIPEILVLDDASYSGSQLGSFIINLQDQLVRSGVSRQQLDSAGIHLLVPFMTRQAKENINSGGRDARVHFHEVRIMETVAEIFEKVKKNAKVNELPSIEDLQNQAEKTYDSLEQRTLTKFWFKEADQASVLEMLWGTVAYPKVNRPGYRSFPFMEGAGRWDTPYKQPEFFEQLKTQVFNDRSGAPVRSGQSPDEPGTPLGLDGPRSEARSQMPEIFSAWSIPGPDAAIDKAKRNDEWLIFRFYSGEGRVEKGMLSFSDKDPGGTWELQTGEKKILLDQPEQQVEALPVLEALMASPVVRTLMRKNLGHWKSFFESLKNGPLGSQSVEWEKSVRETPLRTFTKEEMKERIRKMAEVILMDLTEEQKTEILKEAKEDEYSTPLFLTRMIMEIGSPYPLNTKQEIFLQNLLLKKIRPPRQKKDGLGGLEAQGIARVEAREIDDFEVSGEPVPGVRQMTFKVELQNGQAIIFWILSNGQFVIGLSPETGLMRDVKSPFFRKLTEEIVKNHPGANQAVLGEFIDHPEVWEGMKNFLPELWQKAIQPRKSEVRINEEVNSKKLTGWKKTLEGQYGAGNVEVIAQNPGQRNPPGIEFRITLKPGQKTSVEHLRISRVASQLVDKYPQYEMDSDFKQIVRTQTPQGEVTQIIEKLKLKLPGQESLSQAKKWAEVLAQSLKVPPEIGLGKFQDTHEKRLKEMYPVYMKGRIGFYMGAIAGILASSYHHSAPLLEIKDEQIAAVHQEDADAINKKHDAAWKEINEDPGSDEEKISRRVEIERELKQNQLILFLKNLLPVDMERQNAHVDLILVRARQMLKSASASPARSEARAAGGRPGTGLGPYRQVRSGQSPNEPGTPLGLVGLRSEARKETGEAKVGLAMEELPVPNADVFKTPENFKAWAPKFLEMFSGLNPESREEVKKALLKFAGHNFGEPGSTRGKGLFTAGRNRLTGFGGDLFVDLSRIFEVFLNKLNDDSQFFLGVNDPEEKKKAFLELLRQITPGEQTGRLTALFLNELAHSAGNFASRNVLMLARATAIIRFGASLKSDKLADVRYKGIFKKLLDIIDPSIGGSAPLTPEEAGTFLEMHQKLQSSKQAGNARDERINLLMSYAAEFEKKRNDDTDFSLPATTDEESPLSLGENEVQVPEKYKVSSIPINSKTQGEIEKAIQSNIRASIKKAEEREGLDKSLNISAENRREEIANETERTVLAEYQDRAEGSIRTSIEKDTVLVNYAIVTLRALQYKEDAIQEIINRIYREHHGSLKGADEGPKAAAVIETPAPDEEEAEIDLPPVQTPALEKSVKEIAEILSDRNKIGPWITEFMAALSISGDSAEVLKEFIGEPLSTKGRGLYIQVRDIWGNEAGDIEFHNRFGRIRSFFGNLAKFLKHFSDNLQKDDPDEPFFGETSKSKKIEKFAELIREMTGRMEKQPDFSAAFMTALAGEKADLESEKGVNLAWASALFITERGVDQGSVKQDYSNLEYLLEKNKRSLSDIDTEKLFELDPVYAGTGTNLPALSDFIARLNARERIYYWTNPADKGTGAKKVRDAYKVLAGNMKKSGNELLEPGDARRLSELDGQFFKSSRNGKKWPERDALIKFLKELSGKFRKSADSSLEEDEPFNFSPSKDSPEKPSARPKSSGFARLNFFTELFSSPRLPYLTLVLSTAIVLPLLAFVTPNILTVFLALGALIQTGLFAAGLLNEKAKSYFDAYWNTRSAGTVASLLGLVAYAFLSPLYLKFILVAPVILLTASILYKPQAPGSPTEPVEKTGPFSVLTKSAGVMRVLLVFSGAFLPLLAFVAPVGVTAVLVIAVAFFLSLEVLNDKRALDEKEEEKAERPDLFSAVDVEAAIKKSTLLKEKFMYVNEISSVPGSRSTDFHLSGDRHFTVKVSAVGRKMNELRSSDRSDSGPRKLTEIDFELIRIFLGLALEKGFEDVDFSYYRKASGYGVPAEDFQKFVQKLLEESGYGDDDRTEIDFTLRQFESSYQSEHEGQMGLTIPLAKIASALRSEQRLIPRSELDPERARNRDLVFQELSQALEDPLKISALDTDEIKAGEQTFELIHTEAGDWDLQVADTDSGPDIYPVGDEAGLQLARRLAQVLLAGQELAEADPALDRDPALLAQAFQDFAATALREHSASGTSPPSQRLTVQEALNYRRRMQHIDESGLAAQKQLERMTPREKLKLIVQMALNIDREPTADEIRPFEGSEIGMRKVSEFPGLAEILHQQNLPDHYAGYIEITEEARRFMYKAGAFQTPQSMGFMNAPGIHGPAFLNGTEKNYFRETGSYLYLKSGDSKFAFHESFHHRAGGKTDSPFVSRIDYEDMNILEELAAYRAMNMRPDGTLSQSYTTEQKRNILPTYADSEQKRNELNLAIQAVEYLDSILPPVDVTWILSRARSLQEIIELGQRSEARLIDEFRPGFTREELQNARRAGYDPQQTAVLDLDLEARERAYIRHDLSDPTPEKIQFWADDWALSRVRYLVETGGPAELGLLRQWETEKDDPVLSQAVANALKVLGKTSDAPSTPVSTELGPEGLRSEAREAGGWPDTGPGPYRQVRSELRSEAIDQLAPENPAEVGKFHDQYMEQASGPGLFKSGAQVYEFSKATAYPGVLARYLEIFREIKNQLGGPDLQMVSLGSGDGTVESEIQRNLGIKATGIETGKALAEKSQANGVETLMGDVNKILPGLTGEGRKFDLAYIGESIGFMPIYQTLKNLSAVMKENGRVVISMYPADTAKAYKASSLEAGQVSYPYEDIKKALEAAGFEVLARKELLKSEFPGDADLQRYVRRAVVIDVITAKYAGAPKSEMRVEQKQVNAIAPEAVELLALSLAPTGALKNEARSSASIKAAEELVQSAGSLEIETLRPLLEARVAELLKTLKAKSESAESGKSRDAIVGMDKVEAFVADILGVLAELKDRKLNIGIRVSKDMDTSDTESLLKAIERSRDNIDRVVINSPDGKVGFGFTEKLKNLELLFTVLNNRRLSDFNDTTLTEQGILPVVGKGGMEDLRTNKFLLSVGVENAEQNPDALLDIAESVLQVVTALVLASEIKELSDLDKPEWKAALLKKLFGEGAQTNILNFSKDGVTIDRSVLGAVLMDYKARSEVRKAA